MSYANQGDIYLWATRYFAIQLKKKKVNGHIFKMSNYSFHNPSTTSIAFSQTTGYAHAFRLCADILNLHRPTSCRHPLVMQQLNLHGGFAPLWRLTVICQRLWKLCKHRKPVAVNEQNVIEIQSLLTLGSGDTVLITAKKQSGSLCLLKCAKTIINSESAAC